MPTKDKRKLHCWEDGPRELGGCGSTCMLLAGHVGPHEWTRDDQIIVRFAPRDEEMPEVRGGNLV